MSDIMEMIGYHVESTAEWRRVKAAQFAHDTRNLNAAEELDRLAEEIGNLEGSDIHLEVADLIDRTSGGFPWDRLNDEVSAALRSYGFSGGCGNGREFLEWYRDSVGELLQDEINDDDGGVPPPDLESQVEASEEVRTARQAYEQAKARALAEARKRL